MVCFFLNFCIVCQKLSRTRLMQVSSLPFQIERNCGERERSWLLVAAVALCASEYVLQFLVNVTFSKNKNSSICVVALIVGFLLLLSLSLTDSTVCVFVCKLKSTNKLYFLFNLWKDLFIFHSFLQQNF